MTCFKYEPFVAYCNPSIRAGPSLFAVTAYSILIYTFDKPVPLRQWLEIDRGFEHKTSEALNR